MVKHSLSSSGSSSSFGSNSSFGSAYGERTLSGGFSFGNPKSTSRIAKETIEEEKIDEDRSVRMKADE